MQHVHDVEVVRLCSPFGRQGEVEFVRSRADVAAVRNSPRRLRPSSGDGALSGRQDAGLTASGAPARLEWPRCQHPSHRRPGLFCNLARWPMKSPPGRGPAGTFHAGSVLLLRIRTGKRASHAEYRSEKDALMVAVSLAE